MINNESQKIESNQININNEKVYNDSEISKNIFNKDKERNIEELSKYDLDYSNSNDPNLINYSNSFNNNKSSIHHTLPKKLHLINKKNGSSSKGLLNLKIKIIDNKNDSYNLNENCNHGLNYNTHK